jgi:histidinol-phosphatase
MPAFASEAVMDLLPSLLQQAVRAAQSPSAFILTGFRNPLTQVERKSDGSPVTDFDREAERRIRAVLAQPPGDRWPVTGEELGGDANEADYRWIIDPIDGTFPYTRGLPHFGTLLALDDLRSGRAAIGVIHLPAFAETYTAARGLGAQCNGIQIHTAADCEWQDRVLSLPAASVFEQAGLTEGYAKLCHQGARIFGNADCWMHAMAARGAVDAVVEFNLKRWDIAATEVIVEEAGGRCVIRQSRSDPDKHDIVIGNSQAVEDIVKLIGF